MLKKNFYILFCFSTGHLQYRQGPLVVRGPHFGNDCCTTELLLHQQAVVGEGEASY